MYFQLRQQFHTSQSCSKGRLQVQKIGKECLACARGVDIKVYSEEYDTESNISEL